MKFPHHISEASPKTKQLLLKYHNSLLSRMDKKLEEYKQELNPLIEDMIMSAQPMEDYDKYKAIDRKWLSSVPCYTIKFRNDEHKLQKMPTRLPSYMSDWGTYSVSKECEWDLMCRLSQLNNLEELRTTIQGSWSRGVYWAGLSSVVNDMLYVLGKEGVIEWAEYIIEIAKLFDRGGLPYNWTDKDDVVYYSSRK